MFHKRWVAGSTRPPLLEYDLRLRDRARSIRRPARGSHPLRLEVARVGLRADLARDRSRQLLVGLERVVLCRRRSRTAPSGRPWTASVPTSPSSRGRSSSARSTATIDGGGALVQVLMVAVDVDGHFAGLGVGDPSRWCSPRPIRRGLCAGRGGRRPPPPSAGQQGHGKQCASSLSPGWVAMVPSRFGVQACEVQRDGFGVVESVGLLVRGGERAIDGR